MSDFLIPRKKNQATVIIRSKKKQNSTKQLSIWSLRLIHDLLGSGGLGQYCLFSFAIRNTYSLPRSLGPSLPHTSYCLWNTSHGPAIPYIMWFSLQLRLYLSWPLMVASVSLHDLLNPGVTNATKAASHQHPLLVSHSAKPQLFYMAPSYLQNQDNMGDSHALSSSPSS